MAKVLIIGIVLVALVGLGFIVSEFRVKRMQIDRENFERAWREYFKTLRKQKGNK